MKYVISLLVVFTTLQVTLRAQTSLSTGELMFIGFQSGYQATPTPKDRFAFVILKDITAGTEIILSDNAVKSVSPIRLCNNESTATWKTSTDLTAGTVVVVTESDTNASVGKIKGSLAFSQSGDAIIAFQKVGADTIPLSAIGNVQWLANCLGGGTCGGTNNNTTCLPPPLDATNSLNLETDSNNFFFTIPSQGGTPEEIRAAITNPANWNLSNQGQSWTGASWNFSVVVGNKAIMQADRIHIYPNPASGSIRIEGPCNRTEIFDAMGRSLLQTLLSPDKSLDISTLNKGVYHACFYDGERQIGVQKLVIE